MEALSKETKNDFTAIPDELQKMAEEALGDKESVFIDLNADKPLANWARINKGKNKKKKRKMVKASRRVNRRL